MSSARIQDKGQVTIPTAVRRQAGLSKGDVVDFAVKGSTIVITPKVVDRSQFPRADPEYTPAQRRIIDARLDRADADNKAGRSPGPFKNADEMINDIKAKLRERAAAKRLKHRR